MERSKKLIEFADKDNFAEFRKEYRNIVKEEQNEREKIVKDFIFRRISLGKETGI